MDIVPWARGALPGPVPAHVDYVTDGEPVGDGLRFLGDVLTDPVALLLVAVGGVLVGTATVGYLVAGSRLPDIEVARRTLASYTPYLPWMLRLSVGLPLVGAAFAGYYFTPSVPAEARLLQVGIGFLLLFGLATRATAVVGILAYLGGVVAFGTDMLLASEYLAGFAGLALLGAGQPSADGLLRRLAVTDGTLVNRLAERRPRVRPLLRRAGIDTGLAPVCIRVLLGLNFLLLGVAEKWFQPDRAAAVVARYDLETLLPLAPEVWVFGAGLVEALVGLLLVLGLFSRAAAAAGFLVLTTTLFGLPDDPVLAHVTLFGLSSAVLVTGSGRYSLDRAVVPALARRLRRRFGSGDEGTAGPGLPGDGD
jgi:uncharacterized membrane protein YphA (DoxX/SURF4 family)